MLHAESRRARIHKAFTLCPLTDGHAGSMMGKTANARRCRTSLGGRHEEKNYLWTAGAGRWGRGRGRRLDVVGWANYIARRDPGAEILLHGVSMGAASVLMAAGGPMPRQVRAVVSDCSYTSIEAELRHLLSRWEDRPAGLPMPVGLMLSALRKTTLRRAGYDLRDAAPIQAVVRSRTPTLFIHGVEDDFVPASMMGKLYQAARCPKRFLWMPGAGHAACVGADPEMYWSAVSSFLQSFLPEAPSP